MPCRTRGLYNLWNNLSGFSRNLCIGSPGDESRNRSRCNSGCNTFINGLSSPESSIRAASKSCSSLPRTCYRQNQSTLSSQRILIPFQTVRSLFSQADSRFLHSAPVPDEPSLEALATRCRQSATNNVECNGLFPSRVQRILET